MILTIELTPEEEARLRALAEAKGTNEEETARKMLSESLSHVQIGQAYLGSASTLPGYGKYADRMSSSEEFARRKQEEIALEERDW